MWPPAPYDTLFDPDYRGRIRTGTIRGPEATLKRVLERLDQLELSEETLVVLASDHL